MGLFARIVVGVDGTAWGIAALEQVLALAPPTASVDAVTALNTRPAGRAGFDAPRWVEILTNEASTAQKTAAEMLEERADATARVERGGHPAGALVERKREADLVVVGSRGLHGLRAIGSVSERVAHHARCSVLVVHAG